MERPEYPTPTWVDEAEAHQRIILRREAERTGLEHAALRAEIARLRWELARRPRIVD